MLDKKESQEGDSTQTVMPRYGESVVLYCDGGTRPNPGNGGWGAHGYMYTTEPQQKGSGLHTQLITKYGYHSNALKSKYSNNLVTPVKYFDFFGTSGQNTTNNAAEIDALHRSLEKIKSYDIKDIQVYTDSEYLRRGLDEWVSTWEKNNWKRSDGNPVPNAYNWKLLLNQINDINDKKINFSIKWVKGHSDNYGNSIADKLATIGVLHAMEGRDHNEMLVSDAQGYWKSEVVRHPFINFKRLYFNSLPEYNINGYYYLAEPGGEDYIIGKKMPETSYSVIKLTTPDNVIEVIKERQYDIANMVNAIMLMRLDKIYTPDVFSYIETYGKYSLLQASKSSLGINFVDDKPITLELNPAGLSLRAIENFGLLEDLLERYNDSKKEDVNDNQNKGIGFETHDITSTFFAMEERVKKKETIKECKLKQIFSVGFKELTIDITTEYNGETKTIKIPLILGADLLPRNSLKRIETLNPKITLITWKESKDSIRYACIVEIDTGIGIWSNFFANKIFIK